MREDTHTHTHTLRERKREIEKDMSSNNKSAKVVFSALPETFYRNFSLSFRLLFYKIFFSPPSRCLYATEKMGGVFIIHQYGRHSEKEKERDAGAMEGLCWANGRI